MIPGGDEYVDPMLLMRANFGGGSRASKRPGGSKRPSPDKSKLNFYNESRDNSNYLSPGKREDDFERDSKGTPFIDV